jgi:CheY-like chemotaxis protein
MNNKNPSSQDGATTGDSPERLAQSPEKKRVLIVDDAASVTRLLKLNLEQTNEFVVRTENRGEAALAAAAEFNPDLILLDIMMPGISGDELAPSLRASLPRRPPKIVFLTALASRGQAYSGRDRVLSKPVDLDELLRCLRQELVME